MALSVIPTLVLWLASMCPHGDDLLSNGDFESGGSDAVAIWHPIQPLGESAVFEHPETDAHSGKRCGVLTTKQGVGYSSFTQVIAGPPKQATVLRLAGWIRVDELDEGASASLMVTFDIPENPNSAGVYFTTRLRETCAWTQVQTEVVVPEGARAWIVRCGLTGVGRAAFDDVEVTWSKEADPFEATLAIHHGTYEVRAPNAAKQPWIRFSIPFPFERQTPLAIRVTTDPPGRVFALTLAADRENFPLEVRLTPMERGETVKLRAETLVLVSDRPLSDGQDVALAKPRQVPKQLREHLQPAPGVDSEDPVVREVASRFDRSDLKALTDDLNEYLKGALDYAGGTNQGAKQCLAEGKAVCTGYANVAAALLIGADVPTRILACTQLSGRLQEHYIVEVWTPALGWSRLESTMAVFPWRDSSNLVLRIVYPDSARSPFNVPLYSEAGGGVQGGFDMQGDTCWQGADSVGTFLAGSAEVEAIETAARKAFAALAQRPSEGPALRLAPAKAPRKLSERGLRILAAVAEFEQN